MRSRFGVATRWFHTP